MLRDVRCQACEERREQARGHARQRAQHRGALSHSPVFMNAAKRSIVTVLDDVGRVATSLTWDNCRSTGASTAVPIFLDPVASRPIPVVRRHIAEQTAVRTVSEQMAPDFDGVARSDVLSLDADPLEPTGTGRFESPGRRLPLIVLDFEVDPGMRDQQVYFADRPLHRRPRRDVVVAVGMMRPSRQD
ncbi:MAG: hypothetical protein DMF96_12760 [Acidobacteria bacterium]|nr:MAG: hypothetical protein DMF96_12760 [Acidobacteriota bacterium]